MKETNPNITTKNSSIAIYQNEAFDNGFYRYFKDINNNKISQVLNSTDRKIKFDSISYRE